MKRREVRYMPGFLRRQANDHNQLTRALNKGIVVGTPSVRAETLKDGRVMLHAKAAAVGASEEEAAQVGACANYNDFWPTYYVGPGAGNQWKSYCRRGINLDLDLDAHSVANIAGFDWETAGTPGGASAAPFDPTAAAVEELLPIFADPTPAPVAGIIRVYLYLVMYREITPQEGHPTYVPVSGDPADSIPFVDTICYEVLA